MQVVLLEDVPKLGQKYEVKDVANGYARNFLIPKGYAQMATKSALTRFVELQKKTMALAEAHVKELEAYLEKLGDISITLTGKANDKGHLFAKIHEKDIADALQAQANMSVDTAFIALQAPIAEVGEHDIKIKVNDKEGHFKLIVQEEK